MGSMVRSIARFLLAEANRAPIGERAVRIGLDRVYADSLDRYVAALAWKFGWLEAAERDLIRRQVRNGDITVDVGANIGFHTLSLGRCVGRSGKVYAIEPDARNFRLLSRAIAEARLEQVCLVPAAAAERAGRMSLFLSAVNRGDHRLFSADNSRHSAMVEAVVLDELLAAESRVDFVKMDVQGGEVVVLRGLRETLRRNVEIGLLCELSPSLLREGGFLAEEFFEPMRNAGLTAHRVLPRGALAPIDEKAAWAQAEASGYMNLYFKRP